MYQARRRRTILAHPIAPFQRNLGKYTSQLEVPAQRHLRVLPVLAGHGGHVILQTAQETPTPLPSRSE